MASNGTNPNGLAPIFLTPGKNPFLANKKRIKTESGGSAKKSKLPNRICVIRLVPETPEPGTVNCTFVGIHSDGYVEKIMGDVLFFRQRTPHIDYMDQTDMFKRVFFKALNGIIEANPNGFKKKVFIHLNGVSSATKQHVSQWVTCVLIPEVMKLEEFRPSDRPTYDEETCYEEVHHLTQIINLDGDGERVVQSWADMEGLSIEEWINADVARPYVIWDHGTVPADKMQQWNIRPENLLGNDRDRRDAQIQAVLLAQQQLSQQEQEVPAGNSEETEPEEEEVQESTV